MDDLFFANRLKKLREERKMKQEDLAKVLGINQRTISNWEHMRQEPSIKIIREIARFFKVDTAYLFGMDWDTEVFLKALRAERGTKDGETLSLTAEETTHVLNISPN